MSVLDRRLYWPLGLLTGLVLVVSACSGAPGTPPAARTPAASSGESAGATSTPPAASSGESAGSSPAASPTATPLPDGTFLVTAKNFSFRPLSLEVKAGEPFTIVLKNFDDPGVTHDVDIRKKDGKTVVADQETTDGGQTSDYEYPKLEAGEYVFICSVHPFMTGTLTVN